MLTLARFSRSAHQLSYTATVGDFAFSTSFWYKNANLLKLEESLGASFMERLYLHAIAFDLNRLLSFAPSRVSFGPLAEYVDREFFSLWTQINQGIWSQWRYENDLPDYPGPELDHPLANPVDWEGLPEAGQGNLVFCGGGKDSLLAMKVMEFSGHAFQTLGYSHSIYGRAAPQHALIERLVEVGAGREHRKIWMYDDLMDSPVLEVEPNLSTRTIIAGETPTSLFAALPLALANGYGAFVLAHEKSADVGNLIWDRTGEEVNHQWGKSLEAEELLGTYVGTRLIEGFEYFSILKPLQDAVIFGSLRKFGTDVARTHSCNIDKPWCRRCAKCAYVWLNYQAYLPRERVDRMFEENLFDVPENLIWFRQLLGLEEHTPFECVGQIEEARLAFELCRRKGIRGRAMDVYEAEIEKKPVWADVAHLFRIEGNRDRIPSDMRDRTRQVLRDLAEEAGAYVEEALGAP